MISDKRTLGNNIDSANVSVAAMTACRILREHQSPTNIGKLGSTKTARGGISCLRLRISEPFCRVARSGTLGFCWKQSIRTVTGHSSKRELYSAIVEIPVAFETAPEIERGTNAIYLLNTEIGGRMPFGIDQSPASSAAHTPAFGPAAHSAAHQHDKFKYCP
jgi:hypothetical protein